MPRVARLDAPGVLHHVMARGIERRKIFLDDKERDDFVRRLAAVAAGGVYWACRKLEADAKILAQDIEHWPNNLNNYATSPIADRRGSCRMARRRPLG